MDWILDISLLKWDGTCVFKINDKVKSRICYQNQGLEGARQLQS